MLTRMRLENFKSWKNTGDIALRPITGFFGANSSGKTSLIQALLLLKQTADSRDRRIVFHFGDGKTPVDLGDFEGVVHQHDTSSTLRVSLGWKPQRLFNITDTNTGQRVVRSSRIGFEVAVWETSNLAKTRKSLIVDEMSYRVDDAVFGMRRRGREYDLFTDGTEFEFARSQGRILHLHSLVKCYGFPDQVCAYFTNAGLIPS